MLTFLLACLRVSTGIGIGCADFYFPYYCFISSLKLFLCLVKHLITYPTLITYHALRLSSTRRRSILIEQRRDRFLGLHEQLP